ncbi:MAG: hypothetical protein M1834_007686 [Cirrosporium novae-zelandiae]|nr:MAG: hypothetical protein M1834_007686 [Cirrosporium novae-zelandiae]
MGCGEKFYIETREWKPTCKNGPHIKRHYLVRRSTEPRSPELHYEVIQNRHSIERLRQQQQKNYEQLQLQDQRQDQRQYQLQQQQQQQHRQQELHREQLQLQERQQAQLQQQQQQQRHQQELDRQQLQLQLQQQKQKQRRQHQKLKLQLQEHSHHQHHQQQQPQPMLNQLQQVVNLSPDQQRGSSPSPYSRPRPPHSPPPSLSPPCPPSPPPSPPPRQRKSEKCPTPNIKIVQPHTYNNHVYNHHHDSNHNDFKLRYHRNCHCGCRPSSSSSTSSTNPNLPDDFQGPVFIGPPPIIRAHQRPSRRKPNHNNNGDNEATIDWNLGRRYENKSKNPRRRNIERWSNNASCGRGDDSDDSMSDMRIRR